MKLEREGEGWKAFLFNGDERIELSRVRSDGRTLLLDLDPYDAMIEAEISERGSRLDGTWRKTTAAEKPAELPFHAAAGRRPRFDEDPAAAAGEGAAEVAGRWSVSFASDDDPAIGLFETAPDGSLHGTFLTTTGDYRYLAGSFGDGLLRLSSFDGAHAFLFHATLREDGSLAGDFWSRDTWHDTWTAVRDAEAVLPDPFSLTSPIDGVDLAELVFSDPDGSRRSLADDEFAGPVRIVELFGTWCPNCNDATRYLAELHRRYRDRGLVIVGLAFELTGEFERDARQVREYGRYHGVEYPLLLAGRYGRDEASRSFPLIDRIRAYPTTLFLDASGRVRAVHTGFTGPATGEAHRQLREEFESWVEALLEEAGSGS
jgi:thiol-disulfide isomerase/thioredoxin